MSWVDHCNVWNCHDKSGWKNNVFFLMFSKWMNRRPNKAWTLTWPDPVQVTQFPNSWIQSNESSDIPKYGELQMFLCVSLRCWNIHKMSAAFISQDKLQKKTKTGDISHRHGSALPNCRRMRRRSAGFNSRMPKRESQRGINRYTFKTEIKLSLHRRIYIQSCYSFEMWTFA